MRRNLLFLLLSFTLSSVGLFSQNQVQVFIWDDLDADGFQDAGEIAGTGILTATVELWEDTNTDGTVDLFVESLTSIGDGTYTTSVAGVPDGDYAVVYCTPPPSGGLTYYTTVFNDDGGNNQGTDGNTDSDSDELIPTPAGACPTAHAVSYIFSLSGGSTMVNVDGGYFLPATIEGEVWEDLDGDGIQEGGEGNFPVAVQVCLEDDMGNPVIDANGNPVGCINTTGAYNFPDLVPGNYVVVVTPPVVPEVSYLTTPDYNGGNTDGTDDDDDSDMDQMTGESHVIIVLSGETDDHNDAGLFYPVTISDWVWHDADADGIQDPGPATPNEPDESGQGLENISLVLTDDMGNPVVDVMGNPVPNILTNATGNYLFDQLPPGSYIVQVLIGPPWLGSPQDAGADNVDSDGDPATGLSGVVTLTSGQTTVDLDFGLYALLTVGGTVFIDNNENCQFDGGDGVANGGTIDLWEDTNNDDVPDNFIITGLINGSGVYCFEDVEPGHYMIILTSDIYEGTGSLAGTVPGANCGNPIIDPDNDVENDDNSGGPGNGGGGTSSLTVTLWCGFEGDDNSNKTIDLGNIPSCDVQPIPPASACDSLTELPYSQWFPLCDLTVLENYCAVMHSIPPTNPPVPLCPGGGGAHNMTWFSFVAPTNDLSIEFVPTNCQPGGGGQLGIQAGIYTDCTYSETIFCQPACLTTPLIVDSDMFIPGETYYVFFDGCAGSVCEVEINITINGPLVFQLPEPTLDCDHPSGICDPISVCPGQTVNFSLLDLDLEGIDYFWSLTPDQDVTGFMMLTDVNNQSLTFDAEGTWEFCFIQADNQCDVTDSPPQCFTINSVQPADEIFMDYYVCPNDFPDSGPQNEDPNGDGVLGWMGPAFDGPSAPFSNTFQVTDANGCTYQQSIIVFEHPSQDPGLIDTAFCQGGGIITAGGVNITSASAPPGFVFNDVLLGADLNGCDSMITYTIVEIFSDFEIQELVCLAGCLQIQLVELIPGQSSLYDNAEVTWYDGNSNVLASGPVGSTSLIDVCFNTTVSAEVTITHFGISCLFDAGTFDVDIDSYLPPLLEFEAFDASLCEGADMEVYTLVDPMDPNLFYLWDVSLPGVITDGQGTLSITVDWSAANGPQQVTVYGQNTCGVGPDQIININIIPAPVAEIGATDTICVTGSAIVEYSGGNMNLDGFTWGFDGGNITNGAMLDSPGPFELEWATSGTKYITLEVAEGACISDMVVDSVVVVDPLAIPMLSCGVLTTNSVEFNWTDIVGASGYMVDVITGQMTGSMTGPTQYTVTGLAVNEQVTITVTALGGPPCGDSQASLELTCQAQDCVPPVVTLDIPVMQSDSICLDGSEVPFTFGTMVVPADPGNGVFSGPGVDAMTGEFTPGDANIGSNIITYTYTTDDGCVSSDPIEVWVFNPPTSDFTEVNGLTIVCVGDDVTFEWMGSGTPSQYIWDAPDQVLQSSPMQTMSWMTAGMYQVTLVTEENGCMSTMTTYDVEVSEPIGTPTISCTGSTTTSVSFDWVAPNNICDYDVEIFIDGVSQGITNTTMTTTTVTPLTEGQDVDIIVVANPCAGYPCPGEMDMDMCTASSCPSNLVFDFNVLDGSQYCADASLSTIDFDVMITNGTGMGVMETWSASGGTIDGQGVWDPSGLPGGMYTITYDYSEGTCPYSASVDVELIAQPVADFNVDASMICVDNTVTVTYTGDNGTGYQFAWTFDGANIISGTGVGPYVLQWDNPGTYNLSVTTENTGCNSDPVGLSVDVEDVVPPVTFASCQSDLDNVTFNWNASPCATDYVISYTINGGVVMNMTTAGTTLNIPGLAENDMVDITVGINSAGTCLCPGTDAIDQCTAQSCPAITFSLSAPLTEYCEADAPGPFMVDPGTSGGAGNGVGVWSGSPAIDANTGMFDPSLAVIGANTVVYDYSEGACSYTSMPFTITVFEDPTLSLSSTSSDCFLNPDGTLTFDAMGGDGTYSYFINNQPTTDQNPTVVPGTYDVEVEDGNGCTSTATAVVQSPSQESMSVNGIPTMIVGNSQTLTITTTLDPSEIDDITWTQDGGTVVCSGPQCDTYDYTAVSGTTMFDVVITFNNGCIISGSISITGQDVEIIQVFVPNIFSPNNDGINDLLIVSGSSAITNIKYFRIFDRWGERVFGIDESFIPGDVNAAWNGKFKGEDILPGVYVYILEYETVNGDSVIKSGDVTVVR